MAEAFAPFIINRTIGNLTFYVMEGRNFVRKKSSLTRKRVLHSPQFARTRHYAALMAKASKIGSFVYNALPQYWRQGWMYRSFTGEAITLLKAGKKEPEIQQILSQRYVDPVISKQPTKAITGTLNPAPKRAYRKLNSTYWQRKTIKSARHKAKKQRLLYNAGMLARASKIGSILYQQVPSRYKCRSYFQQLTAWAMQLLRDEWDEADILSELLPGRPIDRSEKYQQPASKINTAGLVIHPNGHYHFITSVYKRWDGAAPPSISIFGLLTSDLRLQFSGF